jgi:hypothetical protein
MYDLTDLCHKPGRAADTDFKLASILWEFASKVNGVSKHDREDGVEPLLRTLSADQWFYSSGKMRRSRNDWFPWHYYTLMPTDISPRKMVQTIIQWALPIQALNVAFVYTFFGNIFLRENFPFGGYFFFLPPTFHYLLSLLLCGASTVPGFRMH